MTKVVDLVKQYFPEADEKEVDFILSAKTGYPSFWHLEEGETTSEQVLERQLAREKERRSTGMTGCYGCGEAFEPVGREREFCPKCLERS